MSIICPRCESENPSSLQYCDFCGYELRSEESPSTVHAPVTLTDPDGSLLSENGLSKTEPVTERGPFSEAELWVALATFLNEHMEGFNVSDVHNIEETQHFWMDETLLDLSDSALKDLPECIGLLSHLEFLDVSDNKFKKVPDVLRQLTDVRTLILWGNKLKTLPDWFAELTLLKDLDISDNKFNEFPEVLCQLPRLRELDLSNNNLIELSDSIGNISLLEDLSISDNELTRLPDTLSKLKAVYELDVSFNKLKSLPSGFETMTNIVSLDLDHNNIASLPEGLENWNQITYFSIKNNPIPPNDLPQNLSKLNGTGKRGLSTVIWLVFLAFTLIPVLFTLFGF